MTKLDTLRSLQQRIREATEPDRELDAEIAAVFLGGETEWKQSNYTMELTPVRKYVSTMHVSGFGRDPVCIYTASLDACVALLNAVLPGCVWERSQSGSFHIYRPATATVPIGYPNYRNDLANDCLTFLDAIVSAVIAEEEARGKAE